MTILRALRVEGQLFYRMTSAICEEGQAQPILDHFRFRDYVLRVPTSSRHINMPSEGVLITSEHTSGFSLPIHPIIREWLATVNLSPIQLSPISYYLLTSTYILYAERLNGPPTCYELLLFYSICENTTTGCNGFFYVQAFKSLFSVSARKTQRWTDQFFYISNRDDFIPSFRSFGYMSELLDAFKLKKSTKRKEIVVGEGLFTDDYALPPLSPVDVSAVVVPPLNTLPTSQYFLPLTKSSAISTLAKQMGRLVIDDILTLGSAPFSLLLL